MSDDSEIDENFKFQLSENPPSANINVQDNQQQLNQEMASNIIHRGALVQVIQAMYARQPNLADSSQNNEKAVIQEQQQQQQANLMQGQLTVRPPAVDNANIRSLHVRDLPQFGAV